MMPISGLGKCHHQMPDSYPCDRTSGKSKLFFFNYAQCISNAVKVPSKA
jgi:hypothetical protein